MNLVRVTPPPVLPVTVAEAKAQTRIGHDEDDALVERLIRAATDHLDGSAGVLGRALVDQTWDMTLDGFPAGAGKAARIALPLPPLLAVVSISYTDAAGEAQTVDLDDVGVTGLRGYAVASVYPLDRWPDTKRGSDVTIRFRAGFPHDEDASPADYAESVPEALRHAILLLAAHWEANREAVVVGSITATMPLAVHALIAPWRVARF